MRRDEEHVVAAFAAWLGAQGWDVRREVERCDVVTTHGGERLYAEAKGLTSSPELDVDTLYGQLLRRMPIYAVSQTRFAVVVPQEVCWHALRVPARVRSLLDAEVYTVALDGFFTAEEH